VILLDTHIWVWWVSNPQRLTPKHREILERGDDRNFAVSSISCWEIAKLVQKRRLRLEADVGLWLETAQKSSGIELINLDSQIIVESTRLPEPFHNDPADQIIVATARVRNCSLMTEDRKILAYRGVAAI
jgi:PIN domain nuclease of toxin-antitoxin system